MRKTYKVNGDIKVQISKAGEGSNYTQAASVFLHGGKKPHTGKIFKNDATVEEIKVWADGFTPKYQVLSPDGITLDYFTDAYHGIDEATKAFKAWAKPFKGQGYFSSARHGRIDLLDLQDFCEFVKK